MLRSYLAPTLLTVFILSIHFVNCFSGETSSKKHMPKIQNLAQGTEFLIAVPPNENPVYPIRKFAVEIYVTSIFDTEVTLEYPGSPAIVRPVNALEVTTFSSLNDSNTLPPDIEIYESEKIVQKAIRITADDPVSVYLLNTKEFTSDGYMALPVSSWGTEYRHVGFYDGIELDSKQYPRGGGFLVIADEDQTSCEITLQGKGKDSEGCGTIDGRNIGDTIEVMLNKGDVYPVCSNGMCRGVYDLTGSKVISDKPVGFISFHKRTTIPSMNKGVAGREHLSEMLPPVNKWGRKFTTVEIQRNDQGDFFRLIASEDNTNWNMKYFDKKTGQILGSQSGAINKAGEFFEYRNIAINGQGTNSFESIRGVSVWSADKPVLLMQYSYSGDWDNNRDFDPFMILIAPDEQYINSTVFQIPSGEGTVAFDNNWFNIIVNGDPSDPGQKRLKSVKLDGRELYLICSDFLNNRIPGTDKYWANLKLQPGAHRIISNTKFSGYIYGFSHLNAYGWPAAMVFNDIRDTTDLVAPEYSVTFDCGTYLIHVTEDNFGPPDWIPYQEDTGIRDIRLEPGSYNLVLEYLSDMQIRQEPPVYEFDFQLRVLNKYQKAVGIFRLEDHAGNVVVDSVVYGPDLPLVELKMQRYGNDESLMPGATIPLEVRVSCDSWLDYPVDQFSFEIVYNSTSFRYADIIEAGDALYDDWTVSAREEVIDGTFSRMVIEGDATDSTSILMNNGLLVVPKITLMLADSIDFEPYFERISFGPRDTCHLYGSEPGRVYTSTCVRSLRPIKYFGQEYFLNVKANEISGNLDLDYGIGLEAATLIEVYDSFGALVDRIGCGNIKPGSYNKEINMIQRSSGAYFVRIKSGPFEEVQPVLLLK